MHHSTRIALYLFGFLAVFGLVIAFAYLLSESALGDGNMSPTGSALWLGGAVLAVIIIVPVFLLKKLTKLSRRVEQDDSTFEVRLFADHQPRPPIS